MISLKSAKKILEMQILISCILLGKIVEETKDVTEKEFTLEDCSNSCNASIIPIA